MQQNPHNPYSHINDEETYAERQARIEAQAQKDKEAKEKGIAKRLPQARANPDQAKADFDALGEEMAKTTDRAELAELGRKRANLVQYTRIRYNYESHCWKCKMRISSSIHAQCPDCTYYICSNCDACFCNSPYNPIRDNAVNPFLPDYPDDIS